ncbi:SfnB family sulfur acquisition oxidoreductase [Paraburkholderia sp. BCC1886]|uniref:SfnB family sulfur acquisition oxidoreductase n=1 Tax=Paraburkholderia sp. BCC1886 TaxID=2562670 RepID=UPI001182EEE6|nr:SfnB family sulfur acquisition oxidoreductase [Paraburkholderia sp. BCC1886]
MNDISHTGVPHGQPANPGDSSARREAHVIGSDAEALAAADRLALQLSGGAAARDQQRRLPHEELALFSASGLGGITVPREYGGADVSFVTLAEVFAILSEADPSVGQIPQNHFGFLNVIRTLGSESQKRRYFAGVLAGKRLGNAGPERGSRNTTDIQTRLTRVDGQLRVSGRKFYSTGALFADWVPTKLLDDEGRMVAAIIERDTPGLTVIDDWSGFGQRTTASGSVLFNDVVVDPDSVLPLWQSAGEPSLIGPVSQIIQAAIDAGIARAAVRETVRFVREQARPWIDAKVDNAGDDPYVIRDTGQLYIELHAADAVLERAARALDRIRASGVTAQTQAEASIAVAKAKVLTTEAALNSAEKLFELSGSRAVLSASNLDRHWRNARVHTLHDPVRWKYFAIGNYLLNGVLPQRHAWI